MNSSRRLFPVFTPPPNTDYNVAPASATGLKIGRKKFGAESETYQHSCGDREGSGGSLGGLSGRASGELGAAPAVRTAGSVRQLDAQPQLRPAS